MPKQSYGYQQIDSESYGHIMRVPNLGPEIPHTGYNFQATNFVCSEIAKQTESCGFIDTAKLLSSASYDDVFKYFVDQCLGKNLIAGEIPVTPKKGQFQLLNDFIFLLKQTLPVEHMPLKKFVAPLTISSPQKEAHGVSLCIEADKQNKILNIMLLEQHAKHDSGPLDYSEEVRMVLNHLQNQFSDSGFQINTFQNNTPICSEKGVCGIVSLEVCRRLIKAQNPMEVAQKRLIKLNAEQVQKLHQENFEKYKNSHSFSNQPQIKSKTENTL